MVDNEHYSEARVKVAEAHGIALGLYETLDDLEESLSVNPRYYAFAACVQKVVELLDVAADELDSYSMELDAGQSAD